MRIIRKTEVSDDRNYWDMTIPNNHNFVLADGTVVHNCGVGCGISVERQFIANLPTVADKLRQSQSIILVEDSKLGWANAVRELTGMLYEGRIPKWDVSLVRPAGSKLKTFGGRASGPAPLEDLFRFLVSVFKEAEGRKLTSIECHDICCKAAEAVVCGGVRRSAILSLTNPSDDRMRHAKHGNWYEVTPWRAMANISACYTEKPGTDVFMREWLALYDSKSGERGIFNRAAAKAQAVKYGRRDPNHDFICNPCSEILARDLGLCNLTEAVIRSSDNLKDLLRKVRLAAILGTMQATLTDFRYLRSGWKKNAEEEALLGVSLTGIMDNELTSGKKGKRELAEVLDEMRLCVVATNKEWAKVLGINQAAATTCTKPSGTVSQLVDCASGIHPRFSQYYIRRVRADKKDPLARMMVDQGFPVEDDVMKPEHQFVFSFPMKSPDGCVVATQMSAIEQLELWKIYQTHWAEHKISMTVYVGEDEWMDVGAWVYRHFNIMSGVAFLPRQGHMYKQTPYEEITKEEYEKMESNSAVKVDWSQLGKYETEDTFVAHKELTCTGSSCELVDVVDRK